MATFEGVNKSCVLPSKSRVEEVAMTKKSIVFVVSMLMCVCAGAQAPAANGQLWLGFQRTNTVMESERAAPHAQGMEGMTTGNPGTSTHYPTTNVCFAVYD